MDWSSSQRTESSPSGQPRNSPFLNILPIIFKERWCLIPQQISPKQIFTSVRYWFIPVSMAFTKKTGDHKCGWGCGEKGTLLYCCWECKLVQPLWRTVWRLLRELSEKAMAPHSSTPAWRIPWTEEPGGLQSWGRWESDMTERIHFHFSLSCIGEGNGSPLQCSCLENPRDGGAWWAAVYGVTQSQTWLT